MADSTVIICCSELLEFKVQEGWNGWESYQPETANCGTCRSYFEKKPLSGHGYKMDTDGFYCTHCSGEILTAGVTHAIWNSPFDAPGGSGSVKREVVPYCSSCEEQPASSGTPIIVSRFVFN